MPTRTTEPSPDGRSRRWATHRETRRAEFVAAAATAIERHGPDVHVDVIASTAGVSKPVLYRYFADKDDLLAATAQTAALGIVEAVTEVLDSDLGPRQTIAAAVTAYLAEVEQHRNLFLLVVRHRPATGDDPLALGRSAAAAVLARRLGDGLRLAGIDPGGAQLWAHAIVGLCVSSAEWWLQQSDLPRQDLAEQLTGFIWHALEGLSRDLPGYSPGYSPGSALPLLTQETP